VYSEFTEFQIKNVKNSYVNLDRQDHAYPLDGISCGALPFQKLIFIYLNNGQLFKNTIHSGILNLT
jgi:hypothetical protein